MIKLLSPDWEIDNVETILFDKDGTFVDLHYFWGKMTEMRALEVIRMFNLEKVLLPTICYYLGYDLNALRMLPDGITALYSRSKIIEIFTAKLKELGLCVTEKEIADIFDSVSEVFYNDIETYIKPIDDAINFIKKIRKFGVKIGIVTSDSVESTKLTLYKQGWEELFDVVIGRESSSETKESGIPTKMAINKLNASPRTTIMIGDAPMDYISAKNAGIEKTILVATGQLSATELIKTSSFVVETLKDLKCLKI